MAISYHYPEHRIGTSMCDSHECLRRAGAKAQEIVQENTERITREAAAETMKAKVAQETMDAAIRVHLDRIVALELEIQRLRTSLAAYMVVED